MFPWEKKKQVTPRQQEVLDLKLRGYKHEQIAEMLGVTIACVNALSFKGSKRLRQKQHEENLRAA